MDRCWALLKVQLMCLVAFISIMTLAQCMNPRVGLVLALYLILFFWTVDFWTAELVGMKLQIWLCQGSDAPNLGMIWNKHILKKRNTVWMHILCYPPLISGYSQHWVILQHQRKSHFIIVQALSWKQNRGEFKILQYDFVASSGLAGSKILQYFLAHLHMSNNL